jgi:hypothetical protein
MLSQADNETFTRVGPGTPMGELFRRFWLPALMPSELPAPDCPPVRVRVMGEDLVAFRDTNGQAGFLAATTTTYGLARPPDFYKLDRIRIDGGDGLLGFAGKLTALTDRRRP